MNGRDSEKKNWVICAQAMHAYIPGEYQSHAPCQQAWVLDLTALQQNHLKTSMNTLWKLPRQDDAHLNSSCGDKDTIVHWCSAGENNRFTTLAPAAFSMGVQWDWTESKEAQLCRYWKQQLPLGIQYSNCNWEFNTTTADISLPEIYLSPPLQFWFQGIPAPRAFYPYDKLAREYIESVYL